MIIGFLSLLTMMPVAKNIFLDGSDVPGNNKYFLLDQKNFETVLIQFQTTISEDQRFVFRLF